MGRPFPFVLSAARPVLRGGDRQAATRLDGGRYGRPKAQRSLQEFQLSNGVRRSDSGDCRLRPGEESDARSFGKIPQAEGLCLGSAGRVTPDRSGGDQRRGRPNGWQGQEAPRKPRATAQEKDRRAQAALRSGKRHKLKGRPQSPKGKGPPKCRLEPLAGGCQRDSLARKAARFQANSELRPQALLRKRHNYHH